jgi:hypothetical protein
MDFSNFYTLVLTIAIVILIVVLGYLGWVMSKASVSDEFPKLRTSCPDLWKVENGPGGEVFCVQPSAGSLNRGEDSNTGGTTTTPLDTAKGVTGNKFNTNDLGWASAGNAVCGKQKWANAHGIKWDTVSNANFCN